MAEKPSATPQGLPGYKNPPLNEIAAGIQFEPLLQWQTRHHGQFWAEVSKDFPETDDQPPILDVQPGQRFVPLVLPPLRRTFLISADQNYVIQLQESRFLLNWRKRKETDVYPHFDTFFNKFLGDWGKFSDFVGHARLGVLKPTKYELSYINHIETESDAAASTAEKYVKMFNWKNQNAAFLPPPTGINVAWTFSLPEQLGFGQASLAQGVKPDGRAVLVFVVSCTGSVSQKDSLNDWFSAAHHWLQRGFQDLTTDAARTDWGYAK